MTDMKKCIDCSAEFKRSRADRTVRCPACRADRAGRTRTSDAERRMHEAHAAMAEVQMAGRAFRREHGYDDERIVAAFKVAHERYRAACAEVLDK